MSFINFQKKYGQYIFSIAFFVDFSITYSLWIGSSTMLNELDKLKHIITLLSFTLLPIGSQILISLLKIWKNDSSKSLDLETNLIKVSNFISGFNFFYSFVVLSMARIIDFFDYNEFSYFISELITGVCDTIFFTFIISLLLKRRKKITRISSIITLNSILIGSIIFGKSSYEPHMNLTILLISSLVALPIAMVVPILLRRKFRKK